MDLDPNLNAFRNDLADASLRDKVEVASFAEGQHGYTQVGIAPVYMRPDSSSEIVTQFHFGEEIEIFDVSDGFAWCQSKRDRYVGYVNEFAVSKSLDVSGRAFIINLGSYVYPHADLRRPPADFYPRHSAVNVAESGILTRDTLYARLSNGYFVPESCLGVERATSRDVISGARLYKGTPYLWGGRSFLGIDCAGLVQNVCEDLGISVLRDTYMQNKTIGIDVGPFSLDLLQAGDFIYFPGHVMIFTDKGNVIHADGRTMTVIEESFSTLIEQRQLSTDIFCIRRLPSIVESSHTRCTYLNWR